MFGEEAGKKTLVGIFFFGLPLIFYKTETAFPTNYSSHLFFWIKFTKKKNSFKPILGLNLMNHGNFILL